MYSIPLRPETMIDIENYTICDKIKAIKSIILKEEYMAMVFSYSIVRYKGKTFAKTVLHHWFAGDII